MLSEKHETFRNTLERHIRHHEASWLTEASTCPACGTPGRLEREDANVASLPGMMDNLDLDFKRHGTTLANVTWRCPACDLSLFRRGVYLSPDQARYRHPLLPKPPRIQERWDVYATDRLPLPSQPSAIVATGLGPLSISSRGSEARLESPPSADARLVAQLACALLDCAVRVDRVDIEPAAAAGLIAVSVSECVEGGMVFVHGQTRAWGAPPAPPGPPPRR